MADGKITLEIDADTAAFVQKVVDAGNKMKKSGDDISAGFKGAKNGMLEVVSNAAAIAGGLMTIVQAVNATTDAAKKLGEANRQAGGRAMTGDAAATGLGMSRQWGQGIGRTAGGVATGDEMLGFAGKLAGINEDRARNNLPTLAPADVAALTNAYRSGGDVAFGQGGGGLTAMLTDPRYRFMPAEQVIGRAAATHLGRGYRGESSSKLISEALGRLSPEALWEIRNRKLDATDKEQYLDRSSGAAGALDADINRQMTINERDAPIMNMTRKVIGLGTDAFTRGYAERQQFGALGVDDSGGSAFLNGDAKTHEQSRGEAIERLLAEQTELMRQQAAPKRSLTTGGEEGK